MSAPLPHVPAITLESTDQFLVSHGKSGVVGVFTAAEPLHLRRGCQVIVETSRGVEIGAVLGSATLRQARLIGASSAGSLIRRLTLDDEATHEMLAQKEPQLFEACRARAIQDGLALEVLDVELLFDGHRLIVQFVGADAGTEAFALALEDQFKLTVRLENLATPTTQDDHEHGCDKPDCGRNAESGSCSTCSTGGGCSSCGSSKVDMREYFSHLRTKMETSQRIPLA